MENFSYSLMVTLFHSVWQMALFLGMYRLLYFHFIKATPLLRRNFLFVLLLAQVVSSAITFIFYSSHINIHLAIGQISLPILVMPAAWLHYGASYLAVIYALMVFFKLGSNLHRWQLFSNGTRNAQTRVPAGLRLFSQLKAAEFGIKRQVSLFYSNAVNSPVVYGYLKPIILLPLSLATNLSLRETETILVHELTHIRNNDYLLNWLLIIVENIYFFNPFMHALAAKIRMEREKACDVQVIMFKYSPVEYAAALLTTARLGKRSLLFQLAAVTEKSLLLQRIQYFSDYNLAQRRKNLLFPSIIVALLFTAGIFAVENVGLPEAALKDFTPTYTFQKITNPQKAVYHSVETSIALTPVHRDGSMVTFTKESRKVSVNSLTQQKNPSFTSELPENTMSPTGMLFQPTPVAFKAGNVPDSVHQVIINEESSNGQILTRAYRVKLVDGQWLSEPLWVMSEDHPRKDSIYIKADSSFRLVPPVQ